MDLLIRIYLIEMNGWRYAWRSLPYTGSALVALGPDEASLYSYQEKQRPHLEDSERESRCYTRRSFLSMLSTG